MTTETLKAEITTLSGQLVLLEGDIAGYKQGLGRVKRTYGALESNNISLAEPIYFKADDETYLPYCDLGGVYINIIAYNEQRIEDMQEEINIIKTKLKKYQKALDILTELEV